MEGILVNYEYCTGCHSCEVACRNARGLAAGEFGIKLAEVGPYRYETPIDADTPYEWVYNPTLTKACDMCAERTATGKMPACVQACPVGALELVDLNTLDEPNAVQFPAGYPSMPRLNPSTRFILPRMPRQIRGQS